MAPTIRRSTSPLIVRSLRALIRAERGRAADAERGQAGVLLLGVKGRHQRAADLAAMSAALAMRDAYLRLFEAPELRPGVPNPRHLSEAGESRPGIRPHGGGGAASRPWRRWIV